MAHPTKHENSDYPQFQLVLNSKMSYERLSEKVGEQISVEPTHLRFYTVSSTGSPKPVPKRGPNQTLQTILNPNAGGYGQLPMGQRNDCLYYEVLDMSLAELETRKSIKVTLLSEGITKTVREKS